MLLDESGFSLLPSIKRTWAPKGETPHFYHLYSPGKISAIAALSVSPQKKWLGLYVRFRTHNLTGIDVRSFLEQLLRHIRKHIVLLWDRGTIHRHKEVKLFLAKHPRIHVEWFPAYAPELNPAEYVWNQEDSSLANSVSNNIAELRQRLWNNTTKIWSSQKLLWSCIHASDLPKL